MKKIIPGLVLSTILFFSIFIMPNISLADIVPFTFNKNFKLGMAGNDVKELQKYLNNNNFPLALNGVGSKGKETSYFGKLTKAALIKFQEKNRPEILDVQDLNSGTGILQSFTRAFINKSLVKTNSAVNNAIIINTANSTSSVFTVNDMLASSSISAITASSSGIITTNSTTIISNSVVDYNTTVRTVRRHSIVKTNVSAPSTPTLASKTATSITLTANSLNQFSKDSESMWQDSEIFTGLTASTEYIFVVRVKETGTTNASVASGGISITTNSLPIAAFTTNPQGGAIPLTVNFTNNSSIDTTSYLWDFGNGATSTEENPSYTYITSGIFSVSLSVGNSNGSDTATDSIHAGILDDASFNYTSATYCQSGANPTPTITGLDGGEFSATPAGLTINPSTGIIDLASSALGVYTLSYLTSGFYPNTNFITTTITNVTPSADFSYSGSPFFQNGTNPLPTFGAGSSAGRFSAPAGLVFTNVNTGEINLASSTLDTYIITNTIPTSGTCLETMATTSVTINGGN